MIGVAQKCVVFPSSTCANFKLRRGLEWADVHGDLRRRSVEDHTGDLWVTAEGNFAVG